jgi:hypothetical protein
MGGPNKSCPGEMSVISERGEVLEIGDRRVNSGQKSATYK